MNKYFFSSIKDTMHSASVAIIDFVAGVIFELRTLCHNHLDRFCLASSAVITFFHILEVPGIHIHLFVLELLHHSHTIPVQAAYN